MFLASGDLIINKRNNGKFLSVIDGKKSKALRMLPTLMTYNITIDIIIIKKF